MGKSVFAFLLFCGGILVLTELLRETSREGNISGEAGGSKLAKQARGDKPGEQGGTSGLMGAAAEVDIESQVPLSDEAEAKTCHTIEKEKFDKATRCVLDKIEKWVNTATGEAKIKEPMIGKDGKTYEKGKVPSSAEPAYSNVIIRQIIDSFPNSKMDKSVPEQSCPISLCPFSTPVVASDGQTYDLNALRRIPANAQGRVKSPITRELLESSVYHNLALTELVECSEEAGDFGSRSAGDKGPVFALGNPQVRIRPDIGAAAVAMAVRQEAMDNAACLATGLGCVGLVAGMVYGGRDELQERPGATDSPHSASLDAAGDVYICGIAGAAAGALLGHVLGRIWGVATLRRHNVEAEGRP